MGIFIVLECVCRLSFKEKADHRNVVQVLGLERLVYFPPLAEGKKEENYR